MCFLFHVDIFMADIYMFTIHYFFFFYIDHSKAILIKKVKISIFVKILWKWHVQLTINAITPYWYIINSKNYLIVCIQNTNYTSIARYRLILKNYEKYWNENFILIYLWKKKNDDSNLIWISIVLYKIV